MFNFLVLNNTKTVRVTQIYNRQNSFSLLTIKTMEFLFILKFYFNNCTCSKMIIQIDRRKTRLFWLYDYK